MTIRAVCPGCRKEYSLDEKFLAKPIRCRQCQQVFDVNAEPAEEEVVEVVEAEEAPAGAMQTRPEPPRPRPAVATTPRRTPATVQKSSSAALWWILGGVAAFLLLLLFVGSIAGVVIFLRVRATEEEAEARQNAEMIRVQSEQQQQQPAVKVDEWNNQNPQGVERQFILPFIEQPGMAPMGGANPQQKPAEPPFKPIVIPQPSAPHLNIRPPALNAERVVRQLPSAVGDVAVGGGGRFLILQLPREKKLAIFDVNEARIVKYLSFADDIQFAAGMDKLLVALPEKRILQRYSLTTFERELSVPLGGEGKVQSLTMGSASNGPLLVRQGGEGIGGVPKLTFYDIRTLKPLDAKWGNNPGGPLDARYIRASANGKVFALLGWGPVTLVWNDGRVTITHLLQGGGLYVVPGPDGKTVFTDSGIYTEFLKPAASVVNVRGAMPATHGRYYMAGQSVYLLGDARPLLTVPVEKAEGQQPPGGFPIMLGQDALALDKRGYFIPDAKLLMHIPLSNDQLILRKLDVEERLEKSGIDYLFVVSHAPVKAKKGAAYRYQLAVKSKKGGVKYRLESGPKGMKVSDTGLVTWDVPANADAEVDVILTVSDRTGQEVFHPFRILPGDVGEDQQPVVVRDVPPAPNKPADPVKPPEKPPEPPPQPKPVLPPTRPSPAIPPAKLSADKVTVTLSSNIADVTEGGGGRYLLLHLPRERKIAVFDVSAAKVIGHVPLAEDNIRFTAGRHKLIVVLADKNVIQRWDLTTFQREAEAPLPVRDKVTAVVMGSASDGPLLVSSAQGAARSELFFMDVATLQKLPIERTGQGHIHIQENDGVRASADGRVFGIWRNQVIPQGIQTLVLQGREAKGYYEHNTAGQLLPGPDGNEIYTAGGRYTSQVKPLGDRRKDPLFCLPAAQPGYFLSIGGEFLSGRSKKGHGPLAVHLAGDERPLTTLPEVELPADINIQSRELLSIDKRIHFIPSAKVIVTIPGPSDRLVLHRFDVEAALAKTDLEYLVVTSAPRTTAKKGGVYIYQLVVKSKKGSVKSSLASGPPGMRLSPRGILVWRVPADFPDDTADVLLSITDASGREVFQKFQIDCRQ